MIPRYNTDLTGEALTNVAKRRVIARTKQKFQEYPKFMSSTTFRDTRRVDTTISNILTLLDKLTGYMSGMIDSIFVSRGGKSEFKSQDDYFIVIEYLRTLTAEELPKLKRYLEFFYNNIANVKLSDFNTVRSSIINFVENYELLKSVSIRDRYSDNLYDMFNFVEPDVSGYLYGGGPGRPRGRPRKNPPQPPATPPTRDIRDFFPNIESEPVEEEEFEIEVPRRRIPRPSIPSRPTLNIEEIEQEDFDEPTETTNVSGLQNIRPTINIGETVNNPNLGVTELQGTYDYEIDRSILFKYWKQLIEQMEGITGIIPWWKSIVATYNETRPSLTSNPKSSIREEEIKDDSAIGEKVGSGQYMYYNVYDAGLPYIPNKYL